VYFLHETENRIIVYYIANFTGIISKSALQKIHDQMVEENYTNSYSLQANDYDA
jgi:hypothetical protein